MPTKESDALRALHASWLERLGANPAMDLVTMRNMFEEWHTVSAEPEGVTYADADADGVAATWCVPVGGVHDRVVVYTHGGGFVLGSRHSHRKVGGHIARATGCRVLVLDYRLAPEAPFPAQLDDAVTAYRWLIGQGITAEHIAVAGDSIGGNLAISTVLRLRQTSMEPPAAIIAFSPWLDMECKAESMTTNAGTDALISSQLLLSIVPMFLGTDGSTIDPLINPLHCDPTGLPPVHLTAGSAEALLGDATRFAELCEHAGVEVALVVAEGMQHVYHLMAGHAPEADQAIAGAAAFARRHLGLT